jgi:signal transduction histidine kinase
VTPPQRPPWWPEGEQWPPKRRGPPPRLAGLVVLAVLAWLLVAALFGALAGTLPGYGWHWIVPALLLLLLFMALGPRRMRGMGVGRRIRELTEAAHRLEATDARRRTFLAELAHELRTPLAVIRAQCEAISDGVYPGDAVHLAPVLEATAAMEALVADLRTLAESEAGALTLNRAPAAVDDLLNDAVAAQSGEADLKGVRLQAAGAAGLPPVDVDAARLRRVLANLMANAIAHTPAGGSVSLRAERSGAQVAISVADSGGGMDPELAAHAFDRFVKAPGSKGSGLGLSIARDIVEAHGGSIGLDSRPGAGTTVRLTLPLA